MGNRFFDTPIEFLKGVGPQRAALLNKELGIFTYADLLQHFPFRYEDRTRFYTIAELQENMPAVQLVVIPEKKELVGAGRKQRLVVHARDHTGQMELVWFQGIKWMLDKVKTGIPYVVFGTPVKYSARYSMAHPEIEPATGQNQQRAYLQPVYPLTEKLRTKHLDNRTLNKLVHELLLLARNKIPETLPHYLLAQYRLMDKQNALFQIHFPENHDLLAAARRRLKFEELFYTQLRLLKLKILRQEKSHGIVLNNTGLLTEFYNHHLPFQLTGAQKRVIREIYADLKSGKQMNRLLQGDVGSGKTIVAFACMLIAAGSGAQCALMAPTEILAQQHFKNISRLAEPLGLKVALLTGSVKKSDRKVIHQQLEDGSLSVLIGTHALIEEKVQFHNLGLAIIDEQHRFGVAQRSRLWHKNKSAEPHVLVMTATPIPRTLAMTLYGDLDVSVIDELPPGRKPVQTIHRFDSHRLAVFGFIKKQIEAGRQVYLVYPLIEESEKTDLKHLMDGYESICRAFPGVPVSIVHGRMDAEAKEYEMQRFVKGETKIMVATTVIEVGVDVPNATVMIIENAERFGLSQLHQLRGRVGRGGSQSYCILMTGPKLTADARKRIQTMVKTNNGFEIAEVDLELRGPGDLLGTRQSGMLDLLIADLGKDQQLLQIAREEAIRLLQNDPLLQKPENQVVYNQINLQRQSSTNWSRIS
ncbi:MAG: ATP-dependent DNA helicase RecG [Cyclobacteriaceae bacterium]|nr:MAG: ATP-dependent DNA helicase RecG [Cyclobacteriaceae bacterium]